MSLRWPAGGRAAEQRSRGVHVSSLFVAVGCHTNDFGFEQGNALRQFVLRIGIEQFPCQLAGSIAFGAGTIVEFHCR